MPCSAGIPEPPPPVTIADRIACMRVNPMTQLPVSTNPTATRPVGVAQIAFSTWTHSGVVNWWVHPSATSRFCSCWKGKWRLGLFYHRFKSWRDFDSFCIGKCLWAFRITSHKFWYLRRKAILRLAMHCIWGLIYRVWKRVLHNGKLVAQIKEWSFWEGRMGGSIWLTQNGVAERWSR